jgi:hypothetical protein
MLDDIRNHDAHPNHEELRWISADPLAGATRALVMIGISVIVGVVASFALAPESVPQPVIATLSAPNP